MKIKYQVTFENESNPIRTLSGIVIATGAGTAANRAVKDAKKQAKGARWSSIVIVLEKVEDSK